MSDSCLQNTVSSHVPLALSPVVPSSAVPSSHVAPLPSSVVPSSPASAVPDSHVPSPLSPDSPAVPGLAALPAKYAHILNAPRHVSAKHAPMPRAQRAAQFMPFAALTGFEDHIDEAARAAACSWDLGEDDIELF